MLFPRAFSISLSAVVGAAALIAPLPAAAQSQLERMEVLSEQVSALMNEAMIAQVPALQGNMPDPAWDEPMRTAYACVLDGYVDASSEAAVDGMLDEMEAMLETATAETLMSGETGQSVQLPDGMSEEQAQGLMQSCGVMEVIMARMAASGAMQVMMDQ
ncbi:MAG: hypothetical protein V2I65_02685 [Paracoccaceae bacterium]|jgi:hypothetical protein|nr:hypothetical protein [Paracoccaceae bacterium]